MLLYKKKFYFDKFCNKKKWENGDAERSDKK
jgi:hypothetical protein